jgi:hypothetical protein
MSKAAPHDSCHRSKDELYSGGVENSNSLYIVVYFFDARSINATTRRHGRALSASVPPQRVNRVSHTTQLQATIQSHTIHYGFPTTCVYDTGSYSSSTTNTGVENFMDYATLIPRFLPASFASPLLTLLTTSLGLTRTLQTHLTPLLTRLITQPDVATILLVVALFFISLKVLDMMYRAVMFWVNMALRLVFWGAIVVLGMWVWNRGVDGFVDDVGGLMEYWTGQYEKYSGEVKMVKEQKEGQIRMKAEQKRRWR